MKHRTFTAIREDGTRETWAFWRDERSPSLWMLRAPDGYIRTLERTWADSVQRIQSIMGNHGLSANVS